MNAIDSLSSPGSIQTAATTLFLQVKHHAVSCDRPGIVCDILTTQNGSYLRVLVIYHPPLTLSPPIPLRLYTLPYWSNPPFLIFDIWPLWRSGLSARAPEYQKLKMVGWTSMALHPSYSCNLEELGLNGLKLKNEFILYLSRAGWFSVRVTVDDWLELSAVTLPLSARTDISSTGPVSNTLVNWSTRNHQLTLLNVRRLKQPAVISLRYDVSDDHIHSDALTTLTDRYEEWWWQLL